MPAHILARLIVMRIRWIQRAVITYTIMWKQYDFDRAELGAEDAYSKLLNSVTYRTKHFITAAIAPVATTNKKNNHQLATAPPNVAGWI